MLGDWLGDTSREQFRAHYLGRAPFARPGTAAATIGHFDWTALGRVLAADPPPDVLVCARGQLLGLPPPTTLAAVEMLFSAGIGLAMRHAQHCDHGLAAIHGELERELGPAQVQLFVTPPGTHGFTWHYDDEDVFIVQTVGTKEYLFRDNTVAPGERARPAVFQRFTEERSPICAATLVPGDFLYVPARWWHIAECGGAGPSLSISVGVFPRGARIAAS
jgi:hypothetical protein